MKSKSSSKRDHIVLLLILRDVLTLMTLTLIAFTRCDLTNHYPTFDLLPNRSILGDQINEINGVLGHLYAHIG